MDSREVALSLGTDAKTLRRFLRTDASSVTPVGSGGRYVFDDADLPTLRTEFARWSEGVVTKTPAPKPTRAPRPRTTAADRDKAVWDDEGDVRLPDMRNPAVRRSVWSAARAQEARLMDLVRAAGLTPHTRA